MTPDQIDVIGQWAATQLEKGESWERINAKLKDFPSLFVNALPLLLKLRGTEKAGADLLGPPVDVVPEGVVERIIEAGEELLRTGDVVHAELVEEEPVELDAETAAEWRELVNPIFLHMRKSGVRSVTIEKTADKQCLLDINMESLEEGGAK